MANKELRANIVIGGKADPSFYALGDSIEGLGQQISQVSKYLIDFGEESVDAYVNYEDAMLSAEVALKTQYGNTAELVKVMDTLGKASLKWARDSRFTTEDVAGAISNAAHAGWDLEEILSGIPAAMKISQAGSMSLSEGLELLVDISNAAGVQFEDLGDLVDYWAFAANKSSANIPEFGAAMQKMGATMRFVNGDMAELTTMLAILADNGTKGTEAGTLLRNTMIRLIAPTKKAAEAMDTLDLTATELEEIYSDSGNLENAVKLLDEAGFSAYDANGNLKSFLTIFQELNAATRGMTEADRNNVLSAIFPTRTITGALALLQAVDSDMMGLYNSIRNGAGGYADYASERMLSGLGGTLMHFESVLNALQTRTGGTLADDVTFWTNQLSGMIDSINEMDEGPFNALVGGLEAIAVAGPALTVAGGAIKGIAMLLGTGPGGWIALGAIGVAALANAMEKFNEVAYESQFGDMALDSNAIEQYLMNVDGGFSKAEQSISAYNTAMEQAIGDYTDASSTMKESLITKMLTNATLSKTDMETLYGYGDQMRNAIIDGIANAHAQDIEGINMIAGMSDQDNSLWKGILETMDYGYQNAIDTANGLSKKLREAMTAAFHDKHLSSEEIDNMQSIMNEMNELLAIETAAQNAAEESVALRKAQTLGLDGLNEISNMAEDRRNKRLAMVEELYIREYTSLAKAGALKVRNNDMTQEELDMKLAGLEAGYNDTVKAAQYESNLFLMRLYENAIAGSDLAGIYSGYGNLADMYFANGYVESIDRYAYENAYRKGDRDKLRRFLTQYAEALGGEETIRGMAEYYAQNGDYESSNKMSRLLAMYTGFSPTAGVPMMYWQNYSAANARAEYGNMLAGIIGASSTSQFLHEAMSMNDADAVKSLMENNPAFRDAFGNIVRNLAGSYDLNAIPIAPGMESVQEYAAAFRILFDEAMNAEEYRLNVDVTGNTKPLEKSIAAVNGEKVRVDITGVLSGFVSTAGNALSFFSNLFAEGGRADEASIFGEAGPEWAIPEEHSARTAGLLDAARKASGFSWSELIGLSGGIGSGKTVNFVYSPTINAADANGVADVLRQDKRSMERWMREQRWHDEVEGYA